MIRLITLNCWKHEGDWAARMAAIGTGLGHLAADIVCLQEVYTGGGRDTGQVLAAATGLICSDVAARHKRRGGTLSSSGLAILSRQPPLAIAAIDLPTSPQDGGRKALIGTFPSAAGPVRIVCLHLSHLRTPEAPALRAAQLAHLLGAAQAEWHGPLALAGDFNASWQSPDLAALHGPGWVSSAVALAGRSSLIGRPAALIDHIALNDPASGQDSKGWQLHQAQIVLDQPMHPHVQPSDHAGIMAILRPPL